MISSENPYYPRAEDGHDDDSERELEDYADAQEGPKARSAWAETLDEGDMERVSPSAPSPIRAPLAR